jgi:hypothetical protein
MTILTTILVYGIPGSLVLSALILVMLWHNPRLLLQDYPKDVRDAVPPKTPAEKRWSAYWAGVFLVLLIAFPGFAALSAKAAHQGFPGVILSAFGVGFLFNLVDWLILDWLIVCTITPKFVVIPGTEGMAGYKNYAMHFKGVLVGTGVSVVMGVLIAALVVSV